MIVALAGLQKGVISTKDTCNFVKVKLILEIALIIVGKLMVMEK